MAWVYSESVPLPKDWSEHVKRAFLCAVSLAHRAMVVAHSWCVNSRIARVRLVAENLALRARLALLEEQMRIKDARMSRIPAESRPHYPPTERLAILTLKASQGWNNAQTGRVFLVTPETIARWLKRINSGEDALVALPTPINRFPDFVALLVQQLRSVCPLMGKQRIADTLARAGLHLSASTVGRMVKRRTVKATPPQSSGPLCKCSIESNADDPSTAGRAENASPKRVVTARFPGHVWHIDLTAVPTSLGFWIPWFPHSWTEHWPFCFSVFVVLDHFSRKAIMVHCFRGTPSAADVTDALDVALVINGGSPKYIISDQGAQFREGYRDWCKLRGIKPRFGAIGQHGSIAVVERFIRSLKGECTRRIIMPLAVHTFQQELVAYATWYNDHRPHQSRQARTPNEVHEGRFPARDKPKLEVRRKPKSRARGIGHVESIVAEVPRLRLVVRHFRGRKHLPIVEIQRAA